MYTATYDDWREQSDDLEPQGLFVCISCGAVNKYWQSTCESCDSDNDLDDESVFEELGRE